MSLTHAQASAPGRADVPGLATDPALPQRDLLLDPRRMRARLARTLGARGGVRIDRCEIVRAKYRVGESVRVVYRLTHAGRVHTVACRTGVTDDAVGVASTRVGGGSAHALRPVVHDRHIDTVFWVFPNDRKLRGLELLTSAVQPWRTLDAGDDVAWWARSRVVAFAPERAATAQCLDRQARVRGYAKVHAGNDAAFGAAVHAALARVLHEEPQGAVTLRVAEVLLHDARRRLLVFAPANGRRLIDLRPADLPEAMASFGAALATLHRLPAPALLDVPRFTRFDASKLQQAARVIARARPDAALAAAALERRFEHCTEPAQPTALLHGDVNSKNWFVHESTVTLIDLDQLATGPAAAELGSMLAAFRFQRHMGMFGAATEATLARAFLDGYAAHAPLPEAHVLRWHTAASLLVERALRAVNRVRWSALTVLPALLADAGALLAEVDHG